MVFFFALGMHLSNSSTGVVILQLSTSPDTLGVAVSFFFGNEWENVANIDTGVDFHDEKKTKHSQLKDCSISTGKVTYCN